MQQLSPQAFSEACNRLFSVPAWIICSNLFPGMCCVSPHSYQHYCSSLVNTHASVPPLFSQALIRQRSKIPNQGMHVFSQASTRFYKPLLELWECQIKLASQAWWSILVIPALVRHRQKTAACSMPSWFTQWNLGQVRLYTKTIFLNK